MQFAKKAAFGLSAMVVGANAATSSAAPGSSVGAATAAATSAAASTVAAASAAGSTAAAATAPAANTFAPFTPTASLSLASTGVSAIPLASITESAATAATNTLNPNLVATPGATPPISGAPALPSWSFAPGTFPALDLVPPTNTSEVEAWIQEVANSGVTIPNIQPTVAGGCSSNTAAAADTSRCWWTCGECTRSTDITTCPDKLTWGVSFDDGPSPYTSDLLNFMDDVQLKSTFFIVGSRAISRPAILQAEFMAGHQLSVHTWSHPYLTTLTNEQVIAELGWTRLAIKQITGLSPNTMRPPYGDIDDRVRAIAQAMGMTPIIWTSYNGNDFDTNDWHVPSGESVDQVIEVWDGILDTAGNGINTGFIVLSHDLWQQTVEIATGYILPDALARRNPQFNLMPIITCQKKPLGDAYIETNNNQTNPFSNNAQPATGTAAITPSGVGGSLVGSTSTSTSTKKSGAEMGVSIASGGRMAAVAFAVAAGAMLVA